MFCIIQCSYRVWNPSLSPNLNPSPAMEMSHNGRSLCLPDLFRPNFIYFLNYITRSCESYETNETDGTLLCIHSHVPFSTPLLIIMLQNIGLLLLFVFFTARKRSLGQGNIFTPVCHSVHGGGMHGERGACMVKGGMHGWGGMCGRGGVCGKRGDMHGKGGVCSERGRHAWYARPPTRYGQSMRGRYASYWNAFLF